jgi:hypothetical protein
LFIFLTELRNGEFCVEAGFIDYFIVFVLDFEKDFMKRGVFSEFLALKVLFRPNQGACKQNLKAHAHVVMA